MSRIEKNNIERLMLLGIGATLLILLMVGSIAWRSSAQSAASDQLVAHTYEVMAQLQQVRTLMEKAESRQWAYFLTKEKRYLIERDVAIVNVKSATKLLRQLTLDNVAQNTRVGHLTQTVDKRITLLNQSLTLFDEKSVAVHFSLSAFDEGQATMGQLQLLLQDTLGAENELLTQRREKESWRLKVIVASIICLLAFLALLSVWIRGVVRTRMRVEKRQLDLERPLLKKGALQNAIFSSANFSIIATDVAGVIQIFNIGAEHMLGYQAADVIDKITPAGISDPQEVILRAANLSTELGTTIAPGFEALVFKASRGIEDIYELTYVRKDGSRMPAIVSVTALHDLDNQVIGYLLIGTDNTIRKQVELEKTLFDQRLREQQFYTRSLIEANIDAMITTDLTGVISDVNQEMASLTGCSRDELIGSAFKKYFTDPERADKAIQRVLNEGQLTNYELTAEARGGRRTVVSYNATILKDSRDNLIGVFATARDITHRKEYEKSLQKNNIELKEARAVAEKANLAKSEFLSSMSHELRTPLNAVLGFAQLMASDNPPPSEVQKLSIDQILQAGWYLLRLINEILDLAMIESGKVSMSHEPMSLTDVLQDCEAMIKPQADQRQVQLHFPQLDAQLYVHADRVRVKQVMTNLLSNAIKYNREGGSVKVTCQPVSGGKIRINVSDTGLGLSVQQLAQMFQPFNRLGRENSAEEGTGIGLVVTKQLVELMGGEIGVESQVGVGSVFWIELIASSLPELESALPDVVTTLGAASVVGVDRGERRTLLYVEDNPANLILVEQLIARRADITLLSAIDGHSGIQMARAHRPDVILMDINLPGISGYGALKILHSDPATRHIPVMALSANAMPRDIDTGLQAGFFRYLTKPIDVFEFMDALDLAMHLVKKHGMNVENDKQ
jgi:PAS domain S-box-containing protein